MLLDKLIMPIIIDGEATDYDIYSDGTIINRKNGKTKATFINNAGRRCCSITYNHTNHAHTVARWLALSFLPEPEEYPLDEAHADHIDGDPLNDVLDNIQWLHYTDNQYKRNNEDGKRNSGSINGRSKITEEDATLIVESIVKGCTNSQIHDEYGYPYPTIESIRCGDAWTFITDAYDLSKYVIRRTRNPKDLRDNVYAIVKNDPNVSSKYIAKLLNLDIKNKKVKSLINNTRKKIRKECGSTTIEKIPRMKIK